MTDRDHFAAAALTGLLSNVQRYQNEPLTRQAFEIADFMLREREKNRMSQNTAETMRSVTEPIPITLTDAEREAIECALIWVNPERQDALRGLLERLW